MNKKHLISCLFTFLFSYANAQELPKRVDNTQFKYFRPVFSQKGDCCGQASGVGYIYTYEVNRLRDLSASELENQYPSHWTWLMLTGGTNRGSISWHGWDVVTHLGVPNLANYYKEVTQTSEERMHAFEMQQMSGYDKWFSALKNKISSRKSWNPDATEKGDLAFIKVKEYLAHHGDNSSVGGIVGLWASSNKLKGDGIKTIPEGLSGAGEKIIVNFGTSGGHLMTIAGYDDEIGYDLNGDGKISNDIDLNGDGVVNRLDWEKGAFLLVNTWGTSWGDNGKAWMMYRLTCESSSKDGYKGARGIKYDSKDARGRMWTCIPKEGAEPELTLKLNYYHSKRENVNFKLGVSLDENALAPTHEISCSRYYGGFWGLGEIPVIGVGMTGKPIEICIDATSLLNKCPGLRDAKKAKFFFKASSTSGTGVVENLSLVSYLEYKEGRFTEFAENNIAFPANMTEIVNTRGSTGVNNIYNDLDVKVISRSLIITGVVVNNVRIYSTLGSLVLEKSNGLSQELVVDLSSLSSGVYVVYMTTADNVVINKKIYVSASR